VPIHSPHSVALEIPRSLAQDIDTADDWEMAELMYRALGAGRE
jgi:CMP-N-acetylneuraminic acid synthetase